MKKNRTVLLAAAVAALPLLSSCATVGHFMTKFALEPSEHGNEIEADRAKTEGRYPGIIEWYDSLHEAGVFKDTTIVGEGGFRLHAIYAPAKDPQNAQGDAVVVHGYTDNHICFLNLVRMYRDTFNFNVMVPDLHYHGYSEGDAIQMGWLDRLDVERWIGVTAELFPTDFMVLHGVSMGAATVMMISGDEAILPPYVRAYVEDCGYTSVWDQFLHNAKQSFAWLPFKKVVLGCASGMCNLEHHWNFKEASSVNQLAKSTRPMLFIHGDADDFVPFSHLQANYDAKTQGYKQMWVAPGTAHAAAFRDHPDEYVKVVEEFINKVKTENL